MRIEKYDVVVVGTGAAGYNAANRIRQFGTKSVCMVTEGKNTGTSRNTGSDKQTYYKLGLGGDIQDSVVNMAQNLFSCGAVDGDQALCEAALSTRCFMNLVELGVPFPADRYGQYCGYKTDHDPYARATSAGPLTSKYMTEALEKQFQELHIPLFDRLYAVKILTDRNGVCGLLCIRASDGEYIAFQTPHIILCTGGPAGIYADSVYPAGHVGSTGLAVEAGAVLQNLTEWQYGLASIHPRWNVSGSYMQVLPRFVSVDENGREHEFLNEYFKNPYDALSNVFLKGYQWPFDSKKVLEGSSVIDILVYREKVMKNRRVYLDYQRNPFDMDEIDYKKLSAEACEYLEKTGVCFGKPIDRLDKMNRPAIELYLSKGVDIRKEYLEISLCAQHHNGGIAVDKWWESSIKGLYAAGECAGTHGITRPGGSALNAGQVGSLRAAQHISISERRVDEASFEKVLKNEQQMQEDRVGKLMKNDSDVRAFIKIVQRKMSDYASAIRNRDEMKALLVEIKNLLSDFDRCVGIKSKQEIRMACLLRGILLTQGAVLSAMIDFTEKIGTTRGSALYTDRNGILRDSLEEIFRFQPEQDFSGDLIQEIVYQNKEYKASWRKVRAIPHSEEAFETMWAGYRDNKNIY